MEAKKKVLHISTECYPAAKAGGMGDVVGALPEYFPQEGYEASVIIPRYNLPWFNQREFTLVYKGYFYLGTNLVGFKILKLKEGELSYPFYCIDIPSKFDRDSIYLDKNGEGFPDEASRNICFQRGIVLWLNQIADFFQLIHCHDHQTGLIPFMMYKCIEFENLRNLPTYFTIHNGSYQGQMSWQVRPMMPAYYDNDYGWLEWDNRINSMAAAIKCCWRYSTVSKAYLAEIKDHLPSINSLLHSEASKGVGILNGIDDQLWDPATDERLHFRLLADDWEAFKHNNKQHLCEQLGLNPELPLFSFIGRLVYQKGADIIPGAIEALYGSGQAANFVILGSGTKKIEEYLTTLEHRFGGHVKVIIMYNETAAHQIYASSDFLLMPSRFEPCGLNQMFAMRYGTIPLAHNTGGLRDTVKDISTGGAGFSFNDCNAHALALTMMRALVLYNDDVKRKAIIKRIVESDFSWTTAIKHYAAEYKKMLGN